MVSLSLSLSRPLSRSLIVRRQATGPTHGDRFLSYAWRFAAPKPVTHRDPIVIECLCRDYDYDNDNDNDNDKAPVMPWAAESSQRQILNIDHGADHPL